MLRMIPNPRLKITILYLQVDKGKGPEGQNIFVLWNFAIELLNNKFSRKSDFTELKVHHHIPLFSSITNIPQCNEHETNTLIGYMINI